MKLRTNLSPEHLDLVSKGVSEASKRKAAARPSPSPQNDAEAELLRQADLTFEAAMNSLQAELSVLLSGDD